MKLNTMTLSLVCLAAFALLFAVSTPAQKLQLPTQAHPAKAVIGDASATHTTQERPKHDAASPASTQTCTYKFASGSGTTYLQFCVTVDGNIVEFQSPAGVEQLNPQGIGPREGYGICDGFTDLAYYDYAYTDSGNWGAPTTVSHTATSVKIERTTSDGAWTLTQTISSVGGTNPYAKVVMALKNNSGTTKEVVLLRFANAVPDSAGSTGNFFQDYDGTVDSAWGNTPYSSTNGSGQYGLMIQNVGNPAPVSIPYFRQGFATTGTAAPEPCNARMNLASPIVEADGSTVYYYVLQLTKDQTGTITERYMPF
jgi:hypothetical protein